MSDNELLLAISNLMDSKLEHITKDVQELKTRFGKLETRFDNLETRLDKLEIRLDSLETRVKNIELNQETRLIPRMDTIHSCYVSTFERYQDSVEDYESMKQDIFIMKKVITEHSQKLENIS